MAFNSDQSSLASDIVAELGDARTLTFTRVTRGAFSGATGTRSDTTSTTTAAGVVGPVETELVGGRPLRSRVFKVLASALAWTPDANDRVTFDGVTWQVKKNGVRMHCGGALLRVECSEIIAGNP